MPDEVTENFKKQIPLGRLGDVKGNCRCCALPRLADGLLHYRQVLNERRLLHGLSAMARQIAQKNSEHPYSDFAGPESCARCRSCGGTASQLNG